MIGPCIRLKRFYGKLGEQKILRSGTGSKNNQTPEKKLVYEAVSHYLGSTAGQGPCTLLPLAMKKIEPKVTMRNKLSREKLRGGSMTTKTTMTI